MSPVLKLSAAVATATCLCAALAGKVCGQNGREAGRTSNFIVILCDNLGYGDLGCFGSKLHRTPHVDNLAAEGMRLSSFYAAAGVCTPSRAALLTGCYPSRVGLDWTEPDGWVLRPISPNGLNPAELTIAELLKSRDYATACIGKWHLGDQLPFLPTAQGFHYYYGIPYSDDMTAQPGRPWPPLPLMRGSAVIEAPADRDTLTQRYTAEAVRFIERHRGRPFFLYLAQAMPGSTARPFASEQFRGRSGNGPYGDSVEELDWSTGVIVETVRRLRLAERTLIIWTSDNGTPRRRPPWGTNKPLSGSGYTTMEGGMRVPCVAWWPGHIPAGTSCDELCTMMDLLPTFALRAGAGLRVDRKIDGHNIWPLLAGRPGARSPYRAFYYYFCSALSAIRRGRWKLHLAINGVKRNSRAGRPMDKLLLYDLETDIGERHNLADKHPAVVKRLLRLADPIRCDLGDGPVRGPGCRPAGRVRQPTPRLLQRAGPGRGET